MFSPTKGRGRRAAAGVLAAMVVGSGLGVASAGPASAAPSDCPSGAICIFENVDFQGPDMYYEVLDGRHPGPACFLVAGEFNDKTSSIVNHSQRNVVFYRDGNCRGPVFTVPPGAQWSNLGGNDNVVSSFSA